MDIRKYIIEAYLTEMVREFWIKDGHAEDAESDSSYGGSGMGHEDHVVLHVLREIADSLDLEYEADQDNFEYLVLDYFADRDPEFNRKDAVGAPTHTIMQSLHRKPVHGFPANEQTKDKLQIAFKEGKADARDYGIFVLGWKAIRGNTAQGPWVETKTLTRADLKDIANGLEDAFGDTMGDSLDDQVFNLDVRQAKTSYQSVPFSVIKAGNPSGLMMYRAPY